MLQSCSSENVDDTSSADISTPVLVKKIIYKSVRGHIETSTFTYNGNKIVRIESAHNDSNKIYFINYTYTENLITKTEESDGAVSTYLYENNKLKTYTYTQPLSDGTIYKLKYVYTHNVDGTVSYTSTYFDYKTNVEIFSHIGTLTFKNNNLVKKEYFRNKDDISTVFIEFDDKSNPFKNVLGWDLSLKEAYRISKNNVIKTTEENKYLSNTTTYHSIHSYTYNMNGFPSEHKRYDTNDVLEETAQYFY